MRRDTILRISSMTKPVTAAAALVLIDDGKLQLDQPVDGVLPELAQRRILKRIDGPLTDTVPVARAITVRDLLTFRMGFGVPLAHLDFKGIDGHTPRRVPAQPSASQCEPTKSQRNSVAVMARQTNTFDQTSVQVGCGVDAEGCVDIRRPRDHQ
jgi:CubicO group peptidase (beta-lactamase class C family)